MRGGEREVPVFDKLKFYDWTFSGTAEAVVGALLVLLLVVSVFTYSPL